MLSGSYDGQVTLFRGEHEGGFAAGVHLIGPDGKAQAVDNAIAASFWDWNGDGRLDLFLGSLSGPVFYVPNTGGLSLGAPIKLKAGGKEFEAPDGGPVLFDWDGDKTGDLILGAEDGSAMFYKGKPGDVPSFEVGRTVIAPIVPAGVEDDQRRIDIFDAAAGKRPAMRPKPAVGDWNGDGKPDLLIGDFTMLRGKAPKLTQAEEAEHKKNTATIDRLSRLLEAMRVKYQAQAMKKLGFKEGQKLDAGQESRLAEETSLLISADPQFDKANNELIEVFGNDQKYQPPVDYHGFVYVFLRK